MVPRTFGRISIVLSRPAQGVCDRSAVSSATVISAVSGLWFLIVLGMISFIFSFDLKPRNLTAIHGSFLRFVVFNSIYFVF